MWVAKLFTNVYADDFESEKRYLEVKVDFVSN